MARRKGRLTTSASNLVPITFPTGSMIDFGGTVAPDGWLMCDGDTVSRTTYAALYAAIGDANGNGDGSTTFTLPDRRGRVSRGSDNMGTAQGAAGRDTFTRSTSGTGGNASGVGSKQEDSNKQHNHSASSAGAGSHAHTVDYNQANSNPGTNPVGFQNVGAAFTKSTSAVGDHSHGVTVNDADSGEATVKNIAQNVIIKI